MADDVYVQYGIIIPGHELEITASRSGGAGGQHVNKTSTRITVRWNIKNTQALTEEQKHRIAQNLAASLTNEGDLIIHNSESRSQQQNKQLALAQLARMIAKALYVPKKRIATKASKQKKEERLQHKTKRSVVKKMRSKKIEYD
jgi:ribosome-associated protein